MKFDIDRSMRFIRELNQKNKRQDFEVAVQRLPKMVGHRNNNLPWLCRKGLAAGLGDDEIYEQIMQHCGRPRLSDYEVRRAIEAAKRPLGVRTRPHIIIRGQHERGFVPRMIEAGRGTTVEGLQRAARLLPTEQNRGAALCAHVQAIVGKDRFDLCNKFYVGTKERGRFMTAFDLIHRIDLDIEPFIIPNALTGEAAPTKDGTGLTTRGDNCVLAPKLMLIEFDALPKDEQLAFVGGVLRENALPVVSVVDSGNKSIHTLVEVEGDDYAALKQKLLRLCCSAEDVRYRCDRAPMHPAALTRLAGAVRPDTGKVQELLWAKIL